MQNFISLFILTLPIFLIVFVGVIIRLVGFADDHFNRISNKIVFTFALPAFLFKKLVEYDFTQDFDFILIIYALAGTIIFFGLTWVLSDHLKFDAKDKGVFIQGSYRGNYAIVGLAIVLNVFGEGLLVKASVLLAFALPLFNILAVIALTYPKIEKDQSYAAQILLNPLILAVIVSIPFNYFQIHIPSFVNTAITYMSDMALPLALINIGSGLDLKFIKDLSSNVWLAAVLKLLVQPIIFVGLAILLGFNHDDVALLFVFFGVPTAIVSYIMSDAMGRNSLLAGKIILLTTLLSIITLPLGIFLIDLFIV